MILIIVTTILAVGLSLYAPSSGNTDSTGKYTLTDKVIRTYDSNFCQGLSTESTNVPDNRQSNATLYLLRGLPPLTDVENFNVTKTAGFKSEGDHLNWNFYLNEGSNVTIKACYETDSDGKSGIDFFLIRGSSNFSKWIDDSCDSDTFVLQHSLFSTTCTTIPYRVVDSGKYYFALYAYSYFSVLLSVDFQFQRTVYHIPPDTVAQQCTIPLNGQATCSVDVPLSSDYTALLSLNASLPVNYGDGADVRISCQPRVWLYAVIVLCAVVPVVIIVTLVIACVCVKARKGKEKYSPLLESGVPTARDAFEDSGNVNVAPGGGNINHHPFNPVYPPASGGYGTISTVPPPPHPQ